MKRRGIIIDDKLLSSMRSPGPCEICGTYCPRREVHHIFARGMSGAFRMDIPINLLSTGTFPYCSCHALAHSGRLERSALLQIVAGREGREVEEMVDELLAIRGGRKLYQCQSKPCP